MSNRRFSGLALIWTGSMLVTASALAQIPSRHPRDETSLSWPVPQQERIVFTSSSLPPGFPPARSMTYAELLSYQQRDAYGKLTPEDRRAHPRTHIVSVLNDEAIVIAPEGENLGIHTFGLLPGRYSLQPKTWEILGISLGMPAGKAKALLLSKQPKMVVRDLSQAVGNQRISIGFAGLLHDVRGIEAFVRVQAFDGHVVGVIFSHFPRNGLAIKDVAARVENLYGLSAPTHAVNSGDFLGWGLDASGKPISPAELASSDGGPCTLKFGSAVSLPSSVEGAWRDDEQFARTYPNCMRVLRVSPVLHPSGSTQDKAGVMQGISMEMLDVAAYERMTTAIQKAKETASRGSAGDPGF